MDDAKREIFDINKFFEGLMKEFPGNKRMQITLGILTADGTPYESLSDVPWHNLNIFEGLQRIVLADLKASDFISGGEEIAKAKERVFQITNKIMLLEIITGLNEFEYIDDLKMLKIFIDLALPGYYREARQAKSDLALLLEKEGDEQDKFDRLIG